MSHHLVVVDKGWEPWHQQHSLATCPTWVIDHTSLHLTVYLSFLVSQRDAGKRGTSPWASTRWNNQTARSWVTDRDLMALAQTPQAQMRQH